MSTEQRANTAVKKIFDKRRLYGDAAKWGVSDFYASHRRRLRSALKLGIDFDTGWYGVKKEIHSGRVRRDGEKITCWANVSDDFDTEGRGESSFEAVEGASVDTLFESVEHHLCTACDSAQEDMWDNRLYYGFSVGPAKENGKRSGWHFTFIAPRGIAEDWDSPPGDNYHWWGWDDQDPTSPEDWVDPALATPNGPALHMVTRNALAEWASKYCDDQEQKSFEAGGWVIEAWEKD